MFVQANNQRGDTWKLTRSKANQLSQYWLLKKVSDITLVPASAYDLGGLESCRYMAISAQPRQPVMEAIRLHPISPIANHLDLGFTDLDLVFLGIPPNPGISYDATLVSGYPDIDLGLFASTPNCPGETPQATSTRSEASWRRPCATQRRKGSTLEIEEEGGVKSRAYFN
ncbi:hypothetical protein ACFE04_030268 [Oxalis oulophora]